MDKLLVFATAREVYSFLWRERGPILRLSWFPMLLVTLIGLFAVRARMDSLREALSSGIAPWDMTGGSYWGVAHNFVTIVGASIVAVALHRVILFGDRYPKTFIHVAFGKVEGLFVLLPVMFLAAIFLLSAASGLAAGRPPNFFHVLLIFSFIAAAIFLAVRFSLVFPIIVVERRYDFAQAWVLSHGNFWRFVGLWFVVMIPPGIVLIAIHSFWLAGLTPPVPGGSAAMIDQFETLSLRAMLLSFPASIIYGALGVGVLSYSYKGLNGLLADELIVTQG